MNSTRKNLSEFIATVPSSSKDSVLTGIAELQCAFEYAMATNLEVWDFAVSLSRLEKIGLSENDIRMLLLFGVVEIAEEVSSNPSDRQFRSVDPCAMFSKNCCIILSQNGRGLPTSGNGQLLPRSNGAQRVPKGGESINGCGINKDTKPFWDCDRRELRFQNDVVKKFKWIAPNQEAVLSAFQEESWPLRIYDPLLPAPEIDAKRRLRDTVKCLNQRHQIERIRFHGDGTGEGVIWELAPDSFN